MVKTLLIVAIREFLGYFSNPVREFPLAYHSELIDGGFSVGDEEID